MRFHTRKRRTPVIIIVSLIDIFVILLIFVIVTTTFKKVQPAVTLKLPESSRSAPVPETAGEAVLLTVSAEGGIFLEAEPVKVEQLSAALRPLVAAKRSIALQADTQAPFGIVIRVMDSLKEAGVQGSLPAFTELRK